MPGLRLVIAGLSTRRNGFDPGPVRVGFLVDKGALGQVSRRVLRVSLVGIIPLTLHFYLHLNTTFIKKTNGRSLGTFKQSVLCLMSGSIRQKSIFMFLGAFAKLRRASISFVTSVRPSAWNNLASTGRIVMKIDI